MWKITLCCNICILILFWLLSQVAIIPVSNLFVQYSETETALPILTGFAIRISSLTGIIPISWTIFTLILGLNMRQQTELEQNKWLAVHTSTTIFVGLTLFLFFLLAGILPLLKIGSFIY